MRGRRRIAKFISLDSNPSGCCLIAVVFFLSPAFTERFGFFDALCAPFVNELANAGFSMHKALHQGFVKRAGFHLGVDRADRETNFTTFAFFEEGPARRSIDVPAQRAENFLLEA